MSQWILPTYRSIKKYGDIPTSLDLYQQSLSRLNIVDMADSGLFLIFLKTIKHVTIVPRAQNVRTV